MPSPAYLPDPNKWINTYSSKPKAPQRPLVAYRHGFPTPPTSVPRNVRTNGNGASGGQVRERQTTQTTLSGLAGPSKPGGPSRLGERGCGGLGMFTPPPTTGERGTRRLGHILDSGSRGSPAPRRKESKLRVRADDYWNSDGDEEGEVHRDKPEQTRTGTAGSSKPVSYLSSRTRPRAPVKMEEKMRTFKPTGKSKNRNKEDKSAAVLSAFSSGELSDLPPEYMTDDERPPPVSRPAARDRSPTPTLALTPALAPAPNPHPVSLAASRPIPSSLTPSTQPRPAAPRHAPPRPFSGTPVPAPASASASAEPTPPEHSPRPLTPVPKNVLAIHRQLCGQNPAQLERVHSPWRRQTSAQRLAREEAWREEDRKMREERKRERESTFAAKQDRKAQVDERVRNRSLLLRGSDGVKRTRSLVDWEESEGSSPKRMRAGVPLTQLRPNSLILTRSPPSKERAERSRVLRLDMATSGVKQAVPYPSIPTKSAKENPSVGQMGLDLDLTSRPNPLVDPTANQDGARPNHATTPRIPPVSSATVAEEPSSPAPPSNPPLSSNPKKSPATGHHTITPPKTTGMRGQAYQETLFAFPPPPQPNFKLDPAPPLRTKQEFRPVEMQAETLLTWSLGPGDAGPKSIDEKEVRHSAGQAGSEQDEGIAGASEPRRRALVASIPIPDGEAKDPQEKTQGISRRCSDSDQSEDASFAPSVYSESFPRLLSSPTVTRTSTAAAARHSPVKAARPADQVAAATQSGNRISTTPKPFPSAPSGWTALHQGILSAPVSAPVPSPSASTPTASTSKGPRRPRQSMGSEATPTQTKLAAFGFFNQHSRRMRNDFDKEWDEEDDLELGMDVDEDEEGPTKRPVDSEDVVGKERPMTGGQLGRVPDAPYHPSLRPAGIRELHRLERFERFANETENQGLGSAYDDNNSIARPRPVPFQASANSRTGHEPPESHGSDEQDEPLFHPRSTSSRSSGSGGSGTGLSSSLTTSDADVPRVSEETKRWWDRIGRSSSGAEQQLGGYDA